jgi:hypothetical protein
MEQSKQSHRLTGSSVNNRGIIKGKKIKDMHLGEVTSCRVTRQAVVKGGGGIWGKGDGYWVMGGRYE